MDKSLLLDRSGAEGEDRLVLARLLDRAEQTEKRNTPSFSDFLSPRLQSSAEDILKRAGVSAWSFWGGYSGAERRIAVFLPDWLEREAAPEYAPIHCIRASFRQEDELTHRDLLGSLMGLGIVREKVGDILVSSRSADVLTLESVAEYLLQNWESAGRARLQVCAITPEELIVPQLRVQDLRDTVSSLRLDAVAASGFHLSRGRAAELITGGHTELNWRICTKADQSLTQGDVLSARGYGKLELLEVGGLTRKGRISILIRRYL